MAIIDNTVDLSTTFSNDIDDTPSIMIDHIMEYACEVVSLGLLFLNYRDTIKEGDGEQVILCWKYMLLKLPTDQIMLLRLVICWPILRCYLLDGHINLCGPDLLMSWL